MADRRALDLPAPSGPPAYAWFAGVMRGDRGGADGALHDAVASIERLGVGRAELELEGSRFLLRLSGETVAGERLDDAGKRSFLAALEECLRATGAGDSLDSTLRCTEVHAGCAVETVFEVDGGTLRPLSRVRGVDLEDLRRAPLSFRPSSTIAVRSRWRAIAMLLALLSIGAIAVWRGGIIGRLRSPDPSALPILTTEFGDRLAVTVRHEFGDYRVEIRRSPTFPDSEEDFALWRERLGGVRERIAWQALSGKGTIYVHSLGEGSRLLHTEAVDLRPIIAEGSRVVVARLRGEPRTTGFAISPVESWGK
jgi:hypothetical protein